MAEACVRNMAIAPMFYLEHRHYDGICGFKSAHVVAMRCNAFRVLHALCFDNTRAMHICTTACPESFSDWGYEKKGASALAPLEWFLWTETKLPLVEGGGKGKRAVKLGRPASSKR